MKVRLTLRLRPALAGQLADYAARKRVPQALVVETALASFLSPDGADRLEAALARRMDRLARILERVERHGIIANEMLALFVRFWLTATPPLRTRPRRPPGQGPRTLRRIYRSLGPASGARHDDSGRTQTRRKKSQAESPRALRDIADCLSLQPRSLLPPRCCCRSRKNPIFLLDRIERRHTPANFGVECDDSDAEPVRCSIPRRPHVAHRIGTGDCRLSGRPQRRRNHAQPGRPALDRPAVGGLEDSGCRIPPADAERIVRLVAHHVGGEVHAASPRVSAEVARRAANASRG